ncbi:hypothetical protein NLI96_g4076 [Meripilus lineatus]|uniref:Uncharacterized protein n=1 Tax=Meripilus lineatus TaxID=2056292 RepID=A0AAD5V5A0_9APHY|nr:hypothetical protein NLI96_g4076 [Physisporinus lineatus]
MGHQSSFPTSIIILVFGSHPTGRLLALTPAALLVLAFWVLQVSVCWRFYLLVLSLDTRVLAVSGLGSRSWSLLSLTSLVFWGYRWFFVTVLAACSGHLDTLGLLLLVY